MILNFFNVLSLVSIFLTSLLTVFFLATRKGVIFENRLLAILLAVFNLQIFYSFATSNFDYMFFLEWHKPLFLLRQAGLLIGPLIYVYVNAFLKRMNRWTDINRLHLVPFVTTIVVLLFMYRGYDQFIIWKSILDLITTIIILTHMLVYIGISVSILRKSGNRQDHSHILAFRSNEHRWLHILLLGFILIWFVNLNSASLYMILQNPRWCAYTASIYALVVFLFINAIMLGILLKPDIYFVITKYKNSKIEHDEKEEYLQRLNEYMEQEKPYLNPDMTLEALAAEISVNPRILSQLINETYKKNFKNYILEYRLRESMMILSDTKHSNLTILEILYQVGFNSKSAFNNQFKLFTNLTPVEYRSKAVNGSRNQFFS